MRTFASIDEFSAAVGEDLGQSPWMVIDQDRVNLFADATDDHQWIHVDPERAAAGPFGTTIAHGFLTLSLVPILMAQVFEVRGLTMLVNYGSDKVRFLRPVPVGSRITVQATLSAVEPTDLGIRATITVTVNLEDGGKPACIAEMITLMVGGSA
jgi:acyl dehydratase